VSPLAHVLRVSTELESVDGQSISPEQEIRPTRHERAFAVPPAEYEARYYEQAAVA
jgi:hypothetical protein